MRLFENIINFTERTNAYISFFKGGIALSSLYLVAMIQVISIVQPIESSAHELRFNVEHALKKQFDSFEEMKCNVEHSSYKDCQLAKYQNELTGTVVKALVSFQDFALYLSAVFFCLSLSLFFIGLSNHQRDTTQDNQATTETSGSEH